VFGNCALLGYYAACSGQFLTNVSVQSTGPIFKGRKGLDIHEFVHRAIIMNTTNEMQLYRFIIPSQPYMFLGDVFAHHQEHLTVFTASGNIHQCRCRLVSWMSWNFKFSTVQKYVAVQVFSERYCTVQEVWCCIVNRFKTVIDFVTVQIYCCQRWHSDRSTTVHMCRHFVVCNYTQYTDTCSADSVI
jgi:hypothetical protein